MTTAAEFFRHAATDQLQLQPLFDHEDQETGGSKYPTLTRLKALHPETGEEMGHLTYYPPKRRGGTMAVDRLETHPDHQRRGVGSALMDEMQRRHPGSRIEHGDRSDAGKAWWKGYTRDKTVTRGRTMASAADFFRTTPGDSTYADEPTTAAKGDHDDQSRTAGRGKPRHDTSAPGAGAADPGTGQLGGDPDPLGEGAAGPGPVAELRPVTFHPGAHKDLAKLDRQDQRRIADTVEALRRGDDGLQTHALSQPLKGWNSTKASRGHRVVHRPTDDGGIHIGYVGLHDYDQAIRRLTFQNTIVPDNTQPYQHHHDWLPTGHFFGPGKSGLDPRLFDGTHLRPEIRQQLLDLLDDFWTPRYGSDWPRWARVYLTGSEASHWYGNGDLDTLIGVNYDEARRSAPPLSHLTDQEIDQRLNEELRAGLDDDDRSLQSDGHATGPWESTFYVNPDSFDIRTLKPYAAYDLTTDTWAVEPVQVPDDFDAHHLPEEDWDRLDDLRDQIQQIEHLPEDDQAAAGAALYDQLHQDRHDAFGPDGTGLYDERNVVWKALDAAPGHPLQDLTDWKKDQTAEAAPTRAAAAVLPVRQAGTVDDDYRMQHRAPGPDSAPLHDPTNGASGFHPGFEENVADGSYGEPHEESLHTLHRAHGRPDEPVTIYRAAPHGVDRISPGDWVSTSGEYARNHAMDGTGPDWPVLKATVPAKHVHTDGNDINEWAYHGPEIHQPEIHHPGDDPNDLGAEQYAGTAVHLTPEDHAFVHDPAQPVAERAERLKQVAPAAHEWEDDPDYAHGAAHEAAEDLPAVPHPATQIVWHSRERASDRTGISWTLHLADDNRDFRTDFTHHDFTTGHHTAARQPYTEDTGDDRPVTFDYFRNTEGAGHHGSQFAQDLEPHGRYITQGALPSHLADDPRYEGGQITFHRPLRMHFGGDYRDPSNWKHQLSARYDGKSGRALSEAIAADGYDGVMTHDEYGPSETVDLTSLRPKTATLFFRQATPEEADRIARQAAAEVEDGMMVALVPPPEIAEQLALPGGEPAAQLHVTLAYLGKTGHYTRQQLADLPQLIGNWASRHRPVTVRIGGVGTFTKPGQNVLWGSADIPGGTHLHSDLEKFLNGHGYRTPSEHGWSPHMTLAYVGDHFRFMPKLPEVSWTASDIIVSTGRVWTKIPFGAAPRNSVDT